MHSLIFKEESIILKIVHVFEKLSKISKYMFVDSKNMFFILKICSRIFYNVHEIQKLFMGLKNMFLNS
jgi:hypothetical protein